MRHSPARLAALAFKLRQASLTKGLPSNLRQQARSAAAQGEALAKAFQKPKVEAPKGRGSQAGGGPVSASAKVGATEKV